MLGWRDLPTDVEKADIGPSARSAMPLFRQLFVTAVEAAPDGSGGPTGGDDREPRRRRRGA